ncbi:AraC family transcriptional regulator [Pendulispora rubella]|uniref:AraC family transcriptional regulator n=1 Tax=Pendulispora rubella TaxID=2741070 RepID=A0ABZ2KUU6_9BACT
MESVTLQPRSARIGLGIELRKTGIGKHRHAPSADHYVSLHAGPPVRIACTNGIRDVRSRGQINVFPAGTAEEWFEDDASDMLHVRLPASLARLAAQEMGLDADRVGIASRCHVRDVQIEHIAWALAAEQRADSPSGLIYRESLGMALAVHLLAHHSAPAAPRTGLSQGQLARVTEYIEAHLGEDVSLLRLARISGVSASHLRALFKRSMGIPVHEYIIQRRVERARALLSHGELPASQVALEAGFSHQSHMARCMRRILGVTPASIARARNHRQT